MGLLQLTPQQREVVQHSYGPALVFAVAGAGKTTAMVHRIERLVREGVCAPQQILATSFGKGNVKDLKRALQAWPHCRGVNVRTLHSLGRAVVETAHKAGHLPQLQLNAQGHNGHSLEQSLLNQTLAQARQANAPFKRELDGLDRQDFLDYVGRCKGNIQYADLAGADVPPMARLQARQAVAPSPTLEWYLSLYQLYEQIRIAQGVLTFDDMLLTGWEVLVKYEAVLSYYQQRFTSVLVDEFQDINHVQSEMLDLITNTHRNYMAIGDDDQTVYEWRGANPTFILNFPERYQAETYLIDDNFRCPASALVLANGVIEHNKKRRRKRLHLTRGFEGDVSLTFAPTINGMSEAIVDEVKKLQGAHVSLKELVILVRLNAQTPPLEQAFIANDIPYHVHTPFYERTEIKTLIDYGRMAWAEQRLMKGERLSPAIWRSILASWGRVANRPKRYLSTPLRRQIGEQARREGRAFTVVLCEIAERVDEMWLQEKLLQLAEDLAWLVEHLTAAASQTLQQFDQRLGYSEFLRTSSGFLQTGVGRAAGVQAFIAYAQGQGSLLEFMTHIRQLAQARVGQDGSKTAVTLSTIHRAKGLEWRHVFIMQCNQEIMPFDGQSVADLEEERRLFYVALTRTQQCLYLYALQHEPLSQFLVEARWRRRFENVRAVQRLLAQAVSTWQVEEMVSLVETVFAYQLQRYFLYWWDATTVVKQRVGKHMVCFGVGVRRYGLQKKLDIHDEALDWWQALVPDFSVSECEMLPVLAAYVAKKEAASLAGGAKRKKRRLAPPKPKQERPPEVIRAGMWVQCDAGWGRIEQVMDLFKRPLSEASASNTFLRLLVILRPGQDAAQVEIDISAARILFLDAKQVYRCLLCKEFAATDSQIVEREHSRYVHDDKVAYQRYQEPVIRLTKWVYARKMPVSNS